jgi:hypothetical protein
MSKATTIGFNGASLHSSVLRVGLTALIVAAVAANVLMSEASSQKPQTRRRPVRRLSICGDPRVPCKTVATFQPNDLSFRLPENAVIYDTDLFYAVILKSVSAADDNCDIFVPESERLAAQALLPGNKVFSSRCAEPGGLSYTGASPKARFMAVYAGMTLADANSMLAAVKAMGKYPGANLRRMRAAFNGT